MFLFRAGQAIPEFLNHGDIHLRLFLIKGFFVLVPGIVGIIGGHRSCRHILAQVFS